MTEHKTFWKPSKRRAVVKKERRAVRRKTRTQVVAEVWRRSRGICARCGKACKKKNETYPGDPDRGEANDKVPRSLGGDPLDVENQELICGACHQPNGQHAPTLARQRVLEGKAPGKPAVRGT